jgi:hypothetical protein
MAMLNWTIVSAGAHASLARLGRNYPVRITTSKAIIALLLALGSVASPAMAFYVPHGSYAKTCREIHLHGPYLTALCARLDGSWRYSRLFAPRCGGFGISNQNGHLACGE